MTGFYDELAPLYHLIYPDWNESIRVQGHKLARLIEADWPARAANTVPRKVLDVSCGIGTQALALAALGHAVTASDLSSNQVWDFDNEGRSAHYDLGFFFVTEDLATQAVSTRVMHSRYYAMSTARLCELMRDAGLENVRRIDDAFFQPVLVGTRPAR